MDTDNEIRQLVLKSRDTERIAILHVSATNFPDDETRKSKKRDKLRQPKHSLPI